MKKFICVVIALGACIRAFAGDDVKTGWNFGPLPAISYNSDLGLQYGVTGDIFYYGDGSTFPAYKHKFNTEISRYTKGMTRLHLFYDSKYLIPGLRFSAAATYMNNPMYSFYGFNGAAAPYYTDEELSPMLGDTPVGDFSFYTMKRNIFRGLMDVQGTISGNLGWAAGVSFWNYNMGEMDFRDYNGAQTLYHLYRENGLIRDDEADGGSRIEFKAGLVYNSRDVEAAPNKGIWAELYLNGSPDVFSDSDYNYLKLCAHFRQYITLIQDRLVFAYHLAYQGTVAGQAPYFVQQNITAIYLKQILSEGLGSINTVRGTLYNRMVGDSYAWANFEARVRLLSFRFLGQSWYAGVNPFFDMGEIVKPYRLAEQQAVADKLVYNSAIGTDDVLHTSAGAGVKLVMNKNFIVSAELAKPFRKQDNPGMSVNIGLNYIF